MQEITVHIPEWFVASDLRVQVGDTGGVSFQVREDGQGWEPVEELGGTVFFQDTNTVPLPFESASAPTTRFKPSGELNVTHGAVAT